MNGYRTLIAVIAIATGMAVLPTAIAFKNGADPGYSGGPEGFGQTPGQNCTACHDFNEGPGGVELFGVPQRYRSGVVYDLTVRITDPQQKAAGFEISAEGTAVHLGDFMLLDAIHTRFAEGGSTGDYVTHTLAGRNDSTANWAANGGSYDYFLAWQAPAVDAGSITFFTAGNAVDNAHADNGDRYYADYATIGFARPGDADGDKDVDLLDFAQLQRCFNGANPAVGAGCEYVDFNDNGAVSLADLAAWVNVRTGPTALQPAGFVLADAVRGGKLYDSWWEVNGAPEPTGDHPLYPAIGQQSGSETFRCNECHGLDYKGLDGAYGSGSHFTGIRGVFGSTLSPRQIFELLKADPATVPNGHHMNAFGMSDRDLWDVAKFTAISVVDTDVYISPGGSFIGDDFIGNFSFSAVCSSCHGLNGTRLDFSDGMTPEYVGTVANENPWEFLHHVRFGHPGTPMPSIDLLGWSVQDAADIGAYAASLPQ